MPKKELYVCPDCGWAGSAKELASRSVTRGLECGRCNSLNVERMLPDGRLIKANADENDPRNAHLIHADARPVKVFQFDTEELKAKYPDNEHISDHCGGCNWTATKIYARAKSEAEAERLIVAGEAGLCGDCFAGMLAEEGSTVKIPEHDATDDLPKHEEDRREQAPERGESTD